MKNIVIKCLPILFILILLTGCYTGYKVKDGQVYHKWIHGGNWTRELTILTDADASTFKRIRHSLNINLGKDKNYVFLDESILQAADPLTFEQIQAYYWKDKNNVYLLQFGDSKIKIEQADPLTFSVIKKYLWAKDKNNVYHEFDALLGVSPNDFVAIDKEWGRDNHYYYWHNLRIDSLDFNSAEIVSDYYIKDKNSVFYKNMRVKDANPSTFKADGVGWFGHDDKFMFDRNKNKGEITDRYRRTYLEKKSKNFLVQALRFLSRI